MQQDVRSLRELARETGIDVSVLSRFSRRERALSQAASDTLADALDMVLVPRTTLSPRKRR